MGNSILGRHIRKLQNLEGLNNSLFTFSIHMSTPVAAETANFVLPVNAMLVAGCVSVSSNDGSAGSTTIAIDNVTQAETDLDGGQLDIAYNASDLFASSDIRNSMVALEGLAGDVYLVTIDADTDTTEATDLNLNLTFAVL